MKNYFKSPVMYVVVTSATSLALALHFYSFKLALHNLQEKHVKLSEQHTEVLLENEGLQDYSHRLESDLEGTTNQLEQTKVVVEKLGVENSDLKGQVSQYQVKLQEAEGQIAVLKKTKRPAIGSTDGEWRYYRLTYYDNEYESTGKSAGHPDYGITKSGRPTQAGVTIAVDPRIIPLGSWVEIKWPDGRIEKRRADDIGGAIKGYDIDYYIPNVTPKHGVDIVGVRIIGAQG